MERRSSFLILNLVLCEMYNNLCLASSLTHSFHVVWITHFFFCLFLNFYFFFILLYNTVLFWPYIDMNPKWHPTPVLLPGKIPWAEEPSGLQSMGSLRVRHDWATSLSLFTFMHWRRKWQPTPVFLPGESQGWGSLVGCRLWGCTESDTTEVT